jgi:hypothetical protein
MRRHLGHLRIRVLDVDRAQCGGDCGPPVPREAATLADADRREHIFDHPAIQLSSRSLAK